MRRIIIDIYDKEDKKLNGLVEINSEELCITHFQDSNFHGTQCNFDGDTENYIEIQNILNEMTNLSRKLNKIYK